MALGDRLSGRGERGGRREWKSGAFEVWNLYGAWQNSETHAASLEVSRYGPRNDYATAVLSPTLSCVTLMHTCGEPSE